MGRFVIAVLVAFIGLAAPHRGFGAADAGALPEPAPAQTPDSTAVVAVIDAFHTALAEADTAAVQRLLSGSAVVQEGGGVEDRAEYLSHHMSADMAFAGAVRGERRLVRVEVRDHVAWVASTSHRVGTFRGREVDLQGAELMVLTREPDGWRISAIHWSSRSR